MQPFMLLPLSYTMKKDKGNKGLLDGKRFESLEREKRCWLQNLSRKKALQLEEKMLSSRLVLEWRDNFPRDNPGLPCDGAEETPNAMSIALLDACKKTVNSLNSGRDLPRD